MAHPTTPNGVLPPEAFQPNQTKLDLLQSLMTPELYQTFMNNFQPLPVTTGTSAPTPIRIDPIAQMSTKEFRASLGQSPQSVATSEASNAPSTFEIDLTGLSPSTPKRLPPSPICNTSAKRQKRSDDSADPFRALLLSDLRILLRNKSLDSKGNKSVLYSRVRESYSLEELQETLPRLTEIEELLRAASVRGGDTSERTLSDAMTSEGLSARIDLDMKFQNLGNGNSGKKEDIWHMVTTKVREALPDDPACRQLPLLPARLKKRWEYATTIAKGYLLAVHKSGNGCIAVPRLLQMNQKFLDFMQSKPDGNMEGLDDGGSEDEDNDPRGRARDRRNADKKESDEFKGKLLGVLEKVIHIPNVQAQAQAQSVPIVQERWQMTLIRFGMANTDYRDVIRAITKKAREVNSDQHDAAMRDIAALYRAGDIDAEYYWIEVQTLYEEMKYVNKEL